MSRREWWRLSDAELAADCEQDWYRASGPGGQKRNKTDSAVRLRHRPTGIIVTATESRIRPENQKKAIRRLREALSLHLRQAVDLNDLPADWQEFAQQGFPKLKAKEERFLGIVAFVLDVVESFAGRLAEAAAGLGTSSSVLARILESSEESWKAIQELRKRHGQQPLRASQSN